LQKIANPEPLQEQVDNSGETEMQFQQLAVQQQGISVQQQNMEMLLEMLGAMKGSFDTMTAVNAAEKQVIRDANGTAIAVRTMV